MFENNFSFILLFGAAPASTGNGLCSSTQAHVPLFHQAMYIQFLDDL